METSREIVLRARIKILTWFFIVGLVLSGATAIPLKSEVNLLAKIFSVDADSTSVIAAWITRVHAALNQTAIQFPFLFYGTDWLAFGHFTIAIAFVGVLRDPVRNSWLFSFGMIACALIVPYAFIFGAIRGIPLWWRLIDCSFGVFGFVPVWLCKKWAEELEKGNQGRTVPMHNDRPAEKQEAARF